MSYVSEVLADSPLVFYRLSGGGGATASDASGNGRDGTYTGTPDRGMPSLVASDTSDLAVYFSGDDYVSRTSGSWMDVTEITVEAVISTTMTAIGNIWDRDNAVRVFQFRVTAAGKLEFHRIGSTGATSTRSVNDGVPHHVAATYDGANIKLYIDGALDTTLPTTGALATGTSTLRIGVNNSSGLTQYFVGTIDEAAMYGTALSAVRIAAHANAVAPTALMTEILADAPLAYWKCDETSGTAIYDYSGNTRNAVLQGSGASLNQMRLGRGGSKSIRFTGASGQHIKYTDGSGLPGGTTVSFETLLRPNSLRGSGSVNGLFQLGPTATGSDGSFGARTADFGLRAGQIQAYAIATWGTVSAAADDIVAGRTVHFAVTRNGTNAKIYLNGIEKLSFSCGSSSISQTVLRFPFNYDNSRELDGWYSDVAFYSTELSGARVLAHALASGVMTDPKRPLVRSRTITRATF